MEEHSDLAANRVQGLNAKKEAASLWEELVARLNSCGNGATKSTDKWIKSWRDWRTETKSKASKLKNYTRGTGGGGPFPTPLNEIEERLMSLMGIEAIDGHPNVIDPAEPQNWTNSTEPAITLNDESLPPDELTTFPSTLADSHSSSDLLTTQSRDILLTAQSSIAIPCTSASLNTHVSNHSSGQKTIPLNTQSSTNILRTSASLNTHASNHSSGQKTIPLNTQPSINIPCTSASFNTHASNHSSGQKTIVLNAKSFANVSCTSATGAFHSISYLSHLSNTKENETVLSSSSPSSHPTTKPQTSQYKTKRLKRQKLAEVKGKRM